MKLPGVISLRNDLPICAMPNGIFLREVCWTSREVDEHPLRRLGAQVGHARLVLDRAHVRLEHQVELPGLGEALLAAVRTGRVVAQVVLAEPLVAVQALDERVVEPGDVAARLPDLRGHDDRGLQADDVVAELDHRTPPGAADVAAQLDAEGTVVPRRAQPSVDLAGLERDPPPLGEGRDGLHQVGHGGSSSLPAAGCGRWRALQSTGRPGRNAPIVWRDDVVPG